MKSNKFVVILEIIIVVCAFIYYIIFKTIPELKSTYGSSDHLFSTKKYNAMYEFLYEDGTNFSIVLDKDNIVYYLMFFDKNSVLLYNRKIEGMHLEEAVSSIYGIIGDRGNLNITYYNDSDLDGFKYILSKYYEDVNYLLGSIKDKALKLGININNDEEMLRDMSFYSLEVARVYKKSVSEISNNIYLEYSDNVYRKIEDYIHTNNLSNLEKGNSLLLIQTIPADKDLKVYPEGESWYYVSSGKVYAYIEFGNKRGYCYSGSIDLRKEGECN